MAMGLISLWSLCCLLFEPTEFVSKIEREEGLGQVWKAVFVEVVSQEQAEARQTSRQ